MSFSVVVICPNCRRETVKVTPNSSILQILEEACKRQKLNPDDYDLRHYSRTLDLSLPLRFANLPNNTQLELIPAKKLRTDSKVTVCLQLENGERIMGDFSPSSTISNVLEQCLSSKSIFLQEVREPVCIYMRQKILGEDIKSTSLRSLGLTKGSAIIRLLYRTPEELENQAHISQPLTSSEGVASPSQEINLSLVTSDPEQTTKLPLFDQYPVKRPNNTEINALEEDGLEMEVDYNENTSKDVHTQETIPKEPESCLKETNNSLKDSVVQMLQMECEAPEDTFQGVGDIKYVGERHAVVYNLDDITDIKKADLPDEFFDVTISDVKYMMEQYKIQRAYLENQPLLTKEQRQRQIIQRLACYDQTVIRIYFPERIVLQAVFHAIETVEIVKDFIQNFLEDKSLNFYLYITPPKEILNPFHTLLEAMLVPASVIYFGCDTQKSSYLHQNLRDNLSDPRAAALAASESRKSSVSTEFVAANSPSTTSTTVESNTVEKEKVSQDTSATRIRLSTSDSQGKILKWLKLSKG